MKLHLPTGLRAALMACFAVVSTVVTTPISASVAGGVVTVSFLCAASSAMADSVTWDANWNLSDAPTDIAAPNILTDLADTYTWLSADGSVHFDTETDETAVILQGTASSASEVNVFGGAGATQSLSSSEGDLNANTWMMVTGGTYTTLAGGNYAQNYLGGEPANFTGNTHIQLKEAADGTLTVRDIIGGNFMEAENATFTGNTYISVEDAVVNGSIVGAGISGHNQTSTFTGNTSIWVYTPLAAASSGASTDIFALPANLIVGGSTGIHNANPKIVLKGNSSVTIDLSAYTPDGAAAEMGKTIIGDAWLLGGTSSTHEGNASVTIKGADSAGDAVSFSQPVVGGSWFAGNGTGSLSGSTVLTVSGGAFSGALVGGSWFAASDGVATQQTGDISLSISGGEVNGNVYGGSYSLNTNEQSHATHGNISLSLTGGSINGNVYAGGGLGSGAQGGMTVASTQVEIGNDVTLGAIIISGGVENSNAASSVTGARTLLLSGSSAYSNLADVSFADFSVVDNASAASINLSTTTSSFTKQGAGALSLSGAAEALQSVSSLSVAAGTLDTGASTLTRGGQGLQSLNVASGAALTTSALTLADGATLALGLAADTLSQTLVEVTGELSVTGQTPLALTLSGVESLAAGSQATLFSWGSAATPLTLSNIDWVNKGDDLQAYELSMVGDSLVLRHVEEMVWDESGTWTAGAATDGKAAIFNTPTDGEATVSISGNVAPQSIVVNNAADSTYTFEADGTGSITGGTSLMKEGEGALVVGLTNSYTGGTTVNGGSLEAAAAGALGSGAVTVNEGATLKASAADAIASNAIVLNGGTLSYTADETRNLGSAAVTHAAGELPEIAVATGSTVTWQDADGSNIQNAVGAGISLSGGGTLVADATSAGASVELAGPISLTDEGTTLELASLGSKTFGSSAAPVDIALGEGTTLRVQQPEAAAPTTIHSTLTGEGTLEIAAGNASANSSVQIAGDNSAFTGSINLGTEGAAAPATPATAPAVLLDYSEGSPVGGEESELNLNGLAFATLNNGGTETTTAADIKVNSNTTQFAQTSGLNNKFSGDVAGESDITWALDATLVDGGQTNTLSGELSGMEGTLSAKGKEGSLARWVLGGAGAMANPILAMSLSADNAYNEFVVDYADEVTLSGVVSGAAKLSQQGAGKLVLTGANTSSGTLSIAEGSSVQLGDAMNAGQWGSSTGANVTGSGTLILTNGTLGGALASGLTVNVDVAAGKTVDMGGTEGSLITGSFTMGEGAILSNVSGNILDKELNMTLGDANIGTAAPGTAMVQFAEAPVTQRAVTSSLGSESTAINLELGAGNVINLLREHRSDGVQSYLTLTNGQLVTAADYSNVNFMGNLDLLDDLGLRIAGVQDGSLVLDGTALGVYIAGEGEDATEVTGYQYFGAYAAVSVMENETLTLNLDGEPDADLDGDGATINNLIGAAGSALVVNNTDASGEVAVVILNTPEADSAITFEGRIGESETGGDVEFIKRGEGTLNVGGTMDTHQLTAEQGSIFLNGNENAFEVLALEGGHIALSGKSYTESLEDTLAGGLLSLAEGAELTVTGANNSLDAAEIAGPGTLVLNGELELSDTARLNGVALMLNGGSASFDESNAQSVSSLSGDGVLNGTGTVENSGLSITGTGGSFEGSLTGNGTLTVAAGASQNFGSAFAGGAGWNLVNNGSMGLDLVRLVRAATPLTLNALNLGENSVTTLYFNTDTPSENLLTLGSIEVAPSATVNLNPGEAQNIVRADSSYVLGTVTGGQPAGELTTITPDMTGVAFMLLDAERSNLSVDADGNLRLNLVTSSRNNLAPLADNSNSAAGAQMLWNAAFNGNTAVGTDIRRLLEALNNPANAGEANRILAAASGASTSVLGAAFASDVERQLRAIRNRSTNMPASSPRQVSKGAFTLNDGPRMAAWINGEGDHRKMDASGFMPGYSLSSWGGTLGMDMTCGENFVGGLAITAMYGDLEAHSADHAKGDFDRYYLSAFGSVKRARWQHTLVGTVGRLDADFDRTVYFGSESYRTHAKPKGWAYGLMYEIGYDIPMDEDATFTLQPIVNVAWRYADISSYSERGSDAGLRVSDQDYNVVTFGAGFRTRAEVGEGWFNRRALFEGRALVKVDTGDRHGAARVAMLGGGGWQERVRTDKLSAVGVELGAGLSIPLGDGNGSIFIDGNAELRSEYSNLNGTIGYRFEF